MNKTPMILVPAYGHVYISKDDMIAAYYKGVDFKVQGTSTYCSCRDFESKEVILGFGDGLYYQVTYYKD